MDKNPLKWASKRHSRPQTFAKMKKVKKRENTEDSADENKLLHLNSLTELCLCLVDFLIGYNVFLSNI